MTMSQAASLWLAVLVGLAGGAGVVLLLAARESHQVTLARRVRQGLPASSTSGAVRPGAGAWARATLLRAVEALGSTSSSVERRLQLVGRSGEIGAFRLQQVVATVLGMVAAGALAALPTVSGRGAGAMLVLPSLLIGAVAGAALWDQALTARARVRQRAIDAQVPDASELAALAVGAGESVPGALDRVARVSSAHLSAELRLTVAEIRLGTPTTRALADLAARNDSAALDRLCQTLITSIERGSPLAGVLHDQARDLREAARQTLMEQGGRREIAMLVPVVFLILPITVLFALYPGLMALQIGP